MKREKRNYFTTRTLSLPITESIAVTALRSVESFFSIATYPFTHEATRRNIRQIVSQLRSKFSGRGKKFLAPALLVVFAIITIAIVGKALANKPVQSATEQRVTIAGPIATAQINKEFQFPLKDAKGKELTRLKYTIETAELRREIIVKGKRATSVAGRQFLILNIKLINEYEKALQINARDYVRVSINGNDTELLAPDIHNDPVEVQAISTKYTRLGVAMNESDSNITLRVGEISGTKEPIVLNFSN